MIETNYHTHTYLCKHAIGDVFDYIEQAIKLNYKALAITDHAPLIKSLTSILHSRRMSFAEYYQIYIPSLEEARKKYQGKIKVLTGLEVEAFKEMSSYYPLFLKDVDFLVLGQHYIEKEGTYKSVYATLTEDEIKIYGQMIVRALQSGYFKILAHPEIFSWNHLNWDQTCEEVSMMIIDAAIKNNVYLEVNANGIRNCYQTNNVFLTNNKENYFYPRYEFWELVSKTNAMVLVNDDAHAPKCLSDAYTKKAYDLALSLHLNIMNDKEL